VSALFDLLPLHGPAIVSAEHAEKMRLAKVNMIRAKADGLRAIAEALDEIAGSGDSDRKMTEAANLYIAGGWA
jgi:hypothetical protein